MARPGHLFLQKLGPPCKNWPGHVMEPGQVFTDGEGLEEALDDAAYEYLTTEGGERYPDGCSESRKRCIRKKEKCFVVEDGEMTLSQARCSAIMYWGRST